MPHIDLPESMPGIVALLQTYTETGHPLGALAQQLLRGESSLTPAERELIAARVSRANDCTFCTQSHAAAARHLMPAGQATVVDAVVDNQDPSVLDERMRALVEIALAVQRGGKHVAPEQVERARAAGADDKAIHDTVLIAAAFCMFNRYVDGLATWAPTDRAMYDAMGEQLAAEGYAPTS